MVGKEKLFVDVIFFNNVFVNFKKILGAAGSIV